MDKTSHWRDEWDPLASKVARMPRLLLASDFDGTLTPIAATPAEAILPAETRALLRQLTECPGVSLAIISGRALADLQVRVGVSDIFYAGNHGLELSGPGIKLHNPHAAKAHGELAKAIAFLVEETAAFEGVFIEDKGATAAVHWRRATAASRAALHDLVREAVGNFPRLRLVAGNCVWELRPKDGWNKGDALANLMTRLRLPADAVLYLGDDVTDEDAFRVASKGLTCRVGETTVETTARHHLHDAADAQEFLRALLQIRSRSHRHDPPPSAQHRSIALRPLAGCGDRP